MKKLIFLLLLSLFLIYPVVSIAQDSEEQLTPIEAIGALDLDSARHGVTVHFPKEEEKARKLGPIVSEALDFYKDSLGIDKGFHLALLDEELWNSYSPYPYGLPYVSYSSYPAVAHLPLEADGVVYDFLIDLEDHVPAELRKKIDETGYNWKDFSAKVVDLIIFHEIGHPYAEAYGIAKPANWFNEFVASYFAYAFMYEAYPEEAYVWKLSGDVILEGYNPEHQTLKEFEELYFRVGVSDYGWYQAAFEKKANQLVEEQGVSFIRDLKRTFPVGTGDLSNKEILDRLEKIAPGFNEWAEIFEEKNQN